MANLIESIVTEEQGFQDLEEPLKNACILKHREIIAESVEEYCKRGSFVRIYPSKQSHIYDKYFSS